jgi:hypothetical protein
MNIAGKALIEGVSALPDIPFVPITSADVGVTMMMKKSVLGTE